MLIFGVFLAGCEAGLHLDGVGATKDQAIRRFDHFTGIVAANDRLVASANFGTLLESSDGVDWDRHELATPAAVMDIAACPNGHIVAVDARHTVWIQSKARSPWVPHKVDTTESLMAVACDKNNHIWLTGSFTTLLSSTDSGQTWVSHSLNEDAQISDIQFIGDFGVASAEFGIMLYSNDTGANWEMGSPIPNEFYPLGIYFKDKLNGWAAGLGGTVFNTIDGGTSWNKQYAESILPVYSFFSYNNDIYAVGDIGTLLVLRDDQWIKPNMLNIPPFYLIGGASLKGKAVIVGGAGSLITVDAEGI